MSALYTPQNLDAVVDGVLTPTRGRGLLLPPTPKPLKQIRQLTSSPIKRWKSSKNSLTKPSLATALYPKKNLHVHNNHTRQ